MKHLLRIIIGIAIFNMQYSICNSQTLSPHVIATSGGYATGGGNSLSWTLGETFTTTLTAGSNMLSQGEQQPEMEIITDPQQDWGPNYPCAGSSSTVDFTAYGIIGSSNVFTAQLSNSSGSFASPVNIGTLTGNASSTINVSIPGGTPSGTGYRIRVVSSLPVFNGKDNGTDITITPGPTATISNNSTICLGNPATVHLVFTGTSPWNYTLSDGSQTVTGSSSTSSANVNIIPTTIGTHNYTITALSDPGCTGSGTGTAIVTVSSAPPANSVSSITAPAAACSGTVQLVSTNVVNGQNIRYSWNTGGNSSVVLFSTNIGGPFSAGPFETTTTSVYTQFGALGASSGYNICVQGVNGCGSTNNKCVWVRGSVSTPSPISGSTIACSNQSNVPYSCGLSTGASVYTWSFSVAGTTMSGQGTPNVSVTYPTFTSGQLCVTAALSCGGSSTSGARCITVSNTPALPAPIAGVAKACPGSTNVAYSVSPVTGATGYNWTVGAGLTIVETPPFTNIIHVNFANPFSGSPSICAYALSSCGSGPGRCKSVSSSVPAQPGAISGPASNVCGSSVQYSIVNVSGATSYTWTIPAGSSGLVGQGTNAIQFTAPSSGTSGQVSVVANTTACTPGTSPARTLTINYKPATPGTITANPSTWCAGASVNFSVAAATPLPVYSWTVTNGTISAGQFSNNIDVTWGSGAGNVSLVANNNCGNSAVRTQSFSSSCREVGNQLAVGSWQLAVYPNPAHDKVTVSIDAKEDANCQLILRDVSGRVVLTQTETIMAGVNTYDLNLIHLSKGVYMLEVKSAQNNWKTKVVVE